MKSFIQILIVGSMAVLPVYAQRAQGSNIETAGRVTAPIDYEAVRKEKIVTAVRITEKITMDGRLEEPVWQQAVPATDFYQHIPHPGEPSGERTEVRFLYDDENLYIGLDCYDSHPEIAFIKELKEDFDFNGTDRVQFAIDSLHDGRSGFTFVTHPAGALRDSQISGTGQTNQDWDGVWDVKVTRDDHGWFAEFVIPFKTLRFSNAPVQEWGLNITRHIYRLNEESNWAPVPIRFSSTRMASAGTLRGIENIHQGMNLKIKPYAIGGVTQTRVNGQLQTIQSLSRLKDYDGGFDAKYSVTPSLTFDTTYRTDFAQVEVDQQQVNLTRFNVFFPEKRDFFLENSGTFSFGPLGNNANSSNLVPFFSRRIGLSPAGTPIPIVGGARLSGQVNKYDVGFLSMKTESLGATPSNNYVAGRMKRNLLRNSWVGAIFTSRDSTKPDDYNRVYGSDAHFLFFDKWEFDSYLMRSDTPGRSGKNQARRFETGWVDDELSTSFEYNAVQTNFNPELGFVRRNNMSQYNGDFAWKPRLDQSDLIKNLIFGTTLDYYKGGDTGKIETRIQDFQLGIQFQNGGSVTFNMTQNFDRLVKPFAIRSNLSIPVGDYKYLGYAAKFATGQNHKIVGTGNVNWGEFWNGHTKTAGGSVNLRPNYHLNFDISYSRSRVELANGSFTTGLIGTKFFYGMTARTALNAFIQYNADTHQVSSNIRFDFIHHPLSDLYLVYNDRRDSTGQLIERGFAVKLTNLFSF